MLDTSPPSSERKRAIPTEEQKYLSVGNDYFRTVIIGREDRSKANKFHLRYSSNDLYTMKKGYSNTIEEENLEDSMEVIDPDSSLQR